MMPGSGYPSGANSCTLPSGPEPDPDIPFAPALPGPVDPTEPGPVTATRGESRCSASWGVSIRTLSVMRFRPGAYAVWPCGRNHEILTTLSAAGPRSEDGGLVSSTRGRREDMAHMRGSACIALWACVGVDAPPMGKEEACEP